MPIVTMPDGTQVQFPDDIPREQIRDMISQRFPDAVPQPREKQSAVSGAIDAFTDGASFGFGDNLTAHEAAILGKTPQGGWFDYSKPYGERYETALTAERGQNRQFYEDNPVTAHTANIAGAVATPLVAAKTGATLLKGGMSAKRAAVLGGSEGAAYGAAHGAGSADGQNVAANAAFGAGTGAAIGAPVSALGQALANRLANRAVPQYQTIDDLKDAKGAAYQRVDDLGVTYKPQAIDDLLTGITDEVAAARMHPMRHPKASSMVEDLQSLKGSSPTLGELDHIRQVVRRDVASSTDPAESFFGRKIIQNIDEFANSAGPNQVIAGDAKAGAEALSEARALNARVAKHDAITSAVDAANLRAASTNSGGNSANATRQNIRREFERSKKPGKGNYSQRERELMRTIVEGSGPQNAARGIGKKLGGALGMMASLGGTYSTGNPLMLGVHGLGHLGRMADEAATTRQVDDLLTEILKGGPKKTAPQSNGLQALQKLLASQVASSHPANVP